MLVLETCCCGLYSLKKGTRIFSGLYILIAFLRIYSILPFVNEGTHMVWTLVYLVFHLVLLTVSFLAFFDTFKERPLPSLLIPFHAVQFVDLLVLLISGVTIALLDIFQNGLTINNEKMEPVAILGWEISFTISVGIFTYCYMVVSSYYKELQGGTEPLSSPSLA